MDDAKSTIQQVESSGDSLFVVQLTDTHLCRSPGGTLLGVDTDRSLQAVIELVQQQHPKMDLVLGTGDLSDQGAVEAYQRLQAYFTLLGGESFWLPGNHDDRDNMEAVASDNRCLSPEIRGGKWQILMLNSQIPGEVGGRLGLAELDRLDTALAAAQDVGLYSLVCLHHQPVAVGCAWLDQQMVVDADDFFAILDRYPGVKGVLWGHIHQQVDLQRNGVALMASPSTCVQFAPNSEDFLADEQPPGYRWLELAADGTLRSGVERVRDISFDVDLESGGYL